MITNTEEQVLPAATRACGCEACKRRKGEPTTIAHGTIHPYTSRPSGGWRAKRNRAEDPAAPTFGVELETHILNRPSGMYAAEAAAWRASHITAAEAVSAAEPARFWHAKHDGSVTGPEFASQPATLAYWRRQRPALESMFKTLLHGGVRSHEGDTAGMHINIGTGAFESAEHLDRFLSLVITDVDWTRRMAQRSPFSFRQWCAPSEVESSHLFIARSVMAFGYCRTSNTSIVNTSHRGRIEFRAPRGTLRIDRFFAKLEWVAAMVEYTRSVQPVYTVDRFMVWAVGSGEYPELARYFEERFNARLQRALTAISI